MQTYNKSIKSDNLQLIYKIIHTTYKKSIKTYNPLQPLTRSLQPILTSCLSTRFKRVDDDDDDDKALCKIQSKRVLDVSPPVWGETPAALRETYRADSI